MSVLPNRSLKVTEPRDDEFSPIELLENMELIAVYVSRVFVAAL